jgi:MGT family glycosyltransferase
MVALGQALQERGHEVVFFNLPDLQGTVSNAGVRFIPYGAEAFPPGAIAAATAKMSSLQGPASFQFFVERMTLLATTAFNELPSLITASALDLLLVDQLFPGGATIADHLRLPFASVACALIVNRDDLAPPPVLMWPYDPSEAGIERNRKGWAGISQVFQPLLQLVNEQRASWQLAPYTDYLEDSFSPLLQIAQQSPGIEFPRQHLPANLHMLGPFRQASNATDAEVAREFPWDRLDGRPLLYASLGTLQNGLEWVFRTILDAVEGLPLQAVVTLGRGALSGPDGLAAGGVPENVILVPYAPQLALLRRATLCITHAGLNTAMDCLSCGVPMVALPIASEQPGIAARIAWTGTGKALALEGLTAETLRAAVLEVLDTPGYREQAQKQADQIAPLEPLTEACRLLETLVSKPTP